MKFIKTKLKNESILDFPQTDMCPLVWKLGKDGKTYELTDEAKYKTSAVIHWILDYFRLSDMQADLAGSITSNSYSDKSDVDIHVMSPDITEKQSEEFNRILRKRFKEVFSVQYPELAFVGQYPIEVYFQVNKFQDMMSVGCYDLINYKWIVLPDVKPADFDPYAEYFNDDMRHVDDIIEDIRSAILTTYENSLVYLKTKDEAFKSELRTNVLSLLSRAADLFTKLRNHRKLSSSPKSVEQALEFRDSEEWKTADSSFKLLDKFGYIAILRELTECKTKLDDNEISFEEVSAKVIKIIDEKLSLKNIQDAEEDYDFKHKLLELENIDEGFKDWMKGAMLAGAVTASTFSQAAPADNARYDSSKNAPIVVLQQKSYKNLSYDNLKNMLANVAYNEAGLDWVKTKDDDSLIAILNIVDHRAGGNPDNYASEMTRPSQFFGAKYVVGKTDATFKEFDPNAQAKKEGGQLSKSQKICWDKCNAYADQLLKGKLKDVLTTTLDDGTIVKHNMIANAKKDNKAAYDSWGKACGKKPAGYASGYDARPIGHHTFGYQPDQDGDVKYNHAKPVNLAKTAAKKLPTTEYTIKAGDTLGKIAAANKTTVKDILSKNTTTIKNPNKIKIGQKIRI